MIWTVILTLMLMVSAPAEAASLPIATIETLQHDGRERTARVFAPTESFADGARPALVISLHGATGRGRDQERTSGFNTLAEDEGFVVAYPDGVGRTWNDGRGLRSYEAQRENVDDVGFLVALIDHLAATRGIDPARVYVNGISNGGLMAMRLACERPERIAGIGVVARSITESLSEACPSGTPVPAMFIMGDADPLVPYAGGEQATAGGRERTPVLGAAATATFWARRNGAVGEPRRSMIADEDRDDGCAGGARLDYGAGRARVAFVTLAGGGHTWPSGHTGLPQRLVGRTSRDVHASRALWAFFSGL